MSHMNFMLVYFFFLLILSNEGQKNPLNCVGLVSKPFIKILSFLLSSLLRISVELDT